MKPEYITYTVAIIVAVMGLTAAALAFINGRLNEAKTEDAWERVFHLTAAILLVGSNLPVV
jgi:hypothetical protein